MAFDFSETQLDALRTYFRVMDAVIAASLIDERTAEEVKGFLDGTELSTWTLLAAHELVDAVRRTNKN